MSQNRHEQITKSETEDTGWGWWIIPVVALGLIVYQIGTAAMTSVFDEEDE
jgi:hypothetical protein